MKPGYWWRAQNSCVDNAKLILINDKAHRNWFNLNCVANANGGVLPDLETIAVKLRMSESRVAAALAELVARRLFDKRDDGSFVPHDWNEWQFRTDADDPTNARRQAEHRKKKAAEMKAIKALLATSQSSLRNMPLRNGVTDVTTKRPEAEERNITTTGTEDRGLGNGKLELSSEAIAAIGGRR